MWLEIIGLTGAYGLVRARLKRKHLDLRLAFLGPLAWLVGEGGAFPALEIIAFQSLGHVPDRNRQCGCVRVRYQGRL